MPFYSLEHILHQSMTACEPWTFIAPFEVSAQIRRDKDSRQEWYHTVDMRWQFYTSVEASNPNQRCGKDNPPRLLWGFVADFDIGIPDERVNEAVTAMKVKPTWVERSLGGNIRLIWVFKNPLRVDGRDFCIALLQAAKKWLNLDLLPSLDEPAFVNPNQTYCNGGVWRKTGFSPLKETELQPFYVRVARDFKFVSSDLNDIPLDAVEARCKEIYPNYNWPNEFVEGAQGPSFWIPESTSPLSAIIKKDGMFTFSGHAEKNFYTWSDVCGKEFVRQYSDNAMTKATLGIYYDGHNYYKKIKDNYEFVTDVALHRYLKVICKVSSKADKSGSSPMEQALSHIEENNRVSGAGPHTFRPQGIINLMGKEYLNTYRNRAIKPAEEKQIWGPNGNFPFISVLLDRLFNPISQLPRFLAWWKYYYESALYLRPRPGQIVFLMGGVNVGKTFMNQKMVGASVGGCADVKKMLVEGVAFNDHYYDQPHWAVDDETGVESPQSQNRFAAVIKGCSANNLFDYRKKFQSGSPVYWEGRIMITLNMNWMSNRLLTPLDNDSRDKICLFRCADQKGMFPPREELEKIVTRELPFFLKWLVDWEVPAEVPRCERFGYESYQEPTLLDKAVQNSKCAWFKEILIEFLIDYFNAEKSATYWRGNASTLLKALKAHPGNDLILHSVKTEQTIRYLEMLEQESLIKIRSETDKMKTRVWIIERLEDLKITPTLIPPLSNDTQRKDQTQ